MCIPLQKKNACWSVRCSFFLAKCCPLLEHKLVRVWCVSLCACVCVCMYAYVVTYVQPIPLAVTFSKAQRSKVSLATFQWQETFDLWAFSFETAFENVTPSGIGCIYTNLRTCIAPYFFWYSAHCIYIQKRKYTHISTAIHAHTLTHICAHTQASQIYGSAFIYIYAHCIYSYEHLHTRTQVLTQIIHIHTYVCIYIYTHIYIYIEIYMYTYMCI